MRTLILFFAALPIWGACGYSKYMPLTISPPNGAVESATEAADAVLTVTNGTPIAAGWRLNIAGATGSWAAINGVQVVKSVGAGTITIEQDSTGFGALTGTVTWRTPATGLTDFPWSFSVTSNNLKTAPTGDVQNASGYDIALYEDDQCATPLYWLIDSYDGSAGTFTGKVKVTLSATADKTVYLFYGKSGVSTFQSTAASVFQANYKGYFLFRDGSTLSVADETGQFTATNDGAAAVAGRIGGGAQFVNTETDFIGLGVNMYSLGIRKNATVGGWYNPSSGAASYSNNLVADWSTNGFVLRTTNLASVVCMIYSSDNTDQRTTATYAMSGGTWYHLVCAPDGSKIRVYGNGVEIGTAGNITKDIGNPGEEIHIGSRGDENASQFLQGSLDEIFVMDTNMSADWILATYFNQAEASSYNTLGAEVDAPVSAAARRRLLL